MIAKYTSTFNCHVASFVFDSDCYTIRIDADDAHAYWFMATSFSFAAALSLRSKEGVPIAEGNVPSSTGRVSAFKALLKKGFYVLRVSSSERGAVGGYNVSWNEDVPPVKCEDMFIARGIDMSSYLTQDDCLETQMIFTRHYRIYLSAGVPVTISEDTPYETGYLSLQNIAGDEVAQGHIEGYYGTSLEFTPQSSGYYLLKVGYGEPRTLGEFSFSVR